MAGRDVKAGRAYIEMYLKDDKLSQGLRTSRRALTRVKIGITAVSAAFTAMAGVAGGVAVAAIKKATDAAGDFAETVAKFETVFRGNSAAVRKWGEDLAETLGVSKQETLSALAALQDLFVPMGFDRSAAAEMSKQLTQLAIDVASFNNVALADVITDFQAAMTGSSETVRKYGVMIDEPTVKQRLFNMGIDPKHATHAEKSMARLQLIMEGTRDAQGDAARTAESYNNQMKRLNAEIEDMWRMIGENFKPALRDILELVNHALNQMTNWSKQTGTAFGGIEKAALQAAASGEWGKVGEIIGLQMEIGLRKTFGNALVTLTKLTAKTGTGILGASATKEGQFAGKLAGDAFDTFSTLTNPKKISLRMGLATNQATPRLTTVDKLEAKLEEIRKLQERSVNATEKLKGLGFQ